MTDHAPIQSPIGKWNVFSMLTPWGRVYYAQHDEITGDGDPAWMFQEAQSIRGLQLEIDEEVQNQS